MSVWSVVAIYIFGFVLTTIAIGAIMKPREDFDKADFVLFTFMALIWPVLLALGIVIVLVEGLFFSIIFKPIRFLMYFGQDLRKQYDEWRKVQKMKECDND